MSEATLGAKNTAHPAISAWVGPPGSELSKVGIELTDSVYVVLSMGVMARMGVLSYEELGESDNFNRGLHCMLDVHPERLPARTPDLSALARKNYAPGQIDELSPCRSRISKNLSATQASGWSLKKSSFVRNGRVNYDRNDPCTA